MLPSGSTIIKLAGPVEERFPDLFFNGNLHFRIDGENMQVLGADHMLDRSIRAVTDWKKYELVLDVPESARQIVFGASLNGEGLLWVDDFSFEEVSRQAPVTSDKPKDEQAKESLQYFEELRSKYPSVYEDVLKNFKERNKTVSTVPANLDFESF